MKSSNGIVKLISGIAFAAIASAGIAKDGAVHTYETVYDADCISFEGDMEFCWVTEGVVTAVYTPSGNVFGKAITYSEDEVRYLGEVIQEITGVYERQGLFKDGVPFTWKSDRRDEVCTVNPYTGESTITTWTYRYANGDFRRQEIINEPGEC